MERLADAGRGVLDLHFDAVDIRLHLVEGAEPRLSGQVGRVGDASGEGVDFFNPTRRIGDQGRVDLLVNRLEGLLLHRLSLHDIAKGHLAGAGSVGASTDGRPARAGDGEALEAPDEKEPVRFKRGDGTHTRRGLAEVEGAERELKIGGEGNRVVVALDEVANAVPLLGGPFVQLLEDVLGEADSPELLFELGGGPPRFAVEGIDAPPCVRRDHVFAYRVGNEGDDVFAVGEVREGAGAEAGKLAKRIASHLVEVGLEQDVADNQRGLVEPALRRSGLDHILVLGFQGEPRAGSRGDPTRHAVLADHRRLLADGEYNVLILAPAVVRVRLVIGDIETLAASKGDVPLDAPPLGQPGIVFGFERPISAVCPCERLGCGLHPRVPFPPPPPAERVGEMVDPVLPTPSGLVAVIEAPLSWV